MKDEKRVRFKFLCDSLQLIRKELDKRAVLSTQKTQAARLGLPWCLKSP